MANGGGNGNPPQYTSVKSHELYISESHSVVPNSLRPHGLYSSWNSLGQNTRVGSHSLPQGIFPTQGPNPGLSYFRQILYQLSHQGSLNCIKRHKKIYIIPKDELPRLEGVQFAIEKEPRTITNSPRKNEAARPKQKQCSVVDVSRDESKIWCCKEQYCIGTWDIRSMNQGKLDVVKQEMVRINTDILGISELKWMGMGEFN